MRDAHHRGLERAYLAAPCNAAFAPTISVSTGASTLRIRIGPAHHHGGGALHGHVVFKALDDAAFFAANSMHEDELVLTQAFSLHFLRPVRGAWIESEGRVVHRTRRLWVAEAVVLDDRGREAARGTGTFLPGGAPLSEVAGYSPSGRDVTNT